MASLVAQLVKNLPAMWETWVQPLGWDDPLEKGKVTHSSILAWTIPWGLQSMGLQRVRHNWVTFTSFQRKCKCQPLYFESKGTSTESRRKTEENTRKRGTNLLILIQWFTSKSRNSSKGSFFRIREVTIKNPWNRNKSDSSWEIELGEEEIGQ